MSPHTTRMRGQGRGVASIARAFAVGVVLPLACGLGVYLVRPHRTLAEGWANVIGLGEVAALARSSAVMRAASRTAPAWLVETLPDALWSFAVAQTITLIWEKGPRSARLAWHVLGFGLVAGWEIAQAFHLVRGTFDLFDLIASATGYLAALVLFSPTTLGLSTARSSS